MNRDFKKYAAAVAMATKASGGSGEANQFDHVAKDLHQSGFDDAYEKLTNLEKRACVEEFAVEIWQLANDGYKS